MGKVFGYPEFYDDGHPCLSYERGGDQDLLQ